MIVLGLHFGHDASVAVIDRGFVRSYVLRERHTRTKHAATLDRHTIELALADAGIEITDIDVCAISSTQLVEPVMDQAGYLSLEPKPLNGETFGSVHYEQLLAAGRTIEELQTTSLLDIVYGERDQNPFQYDVWSRLFPEHANLKREDIVSFPWFDSYMNHQVWDNGLTLEELRTLKFDGGIENTGLSMSFHYPATVTIAGQTLPACYVHHHLCHAAASFYLSGFEDAFVLSHDGFANGRGYHSGMLYYADGHKIHPLGPHHLALGGLYDYVGVHLGLGSVGPAGKLMGLAAYGQPRFFDPLYVGNEKFHRDNNIELIAHWIRHCEIQAEHMGYDFSHYRDADYATDPINADIAASTQKLFEEVRLKAVHSLYELGRHNGVKSKNLSLSGGTALNCPSNTQIFLEGPFQNVYVEPCCDDSGIAIGAGLALYHNILGYARMDQIGQASPFLGVRHKQDDLETLLSDNPSIKVVKVADWATEAAKEVAQDGVIGWFEGRSEIGPRALGARSIIAHPGYQENWERVNRIKKRELWRPFAPAVLESEAGNWFAGVPVPSPYMLFNAQVKSQQLPAVTHVDNTARIQTVNESNGQYFRLIEEFYRITGIPVVMNTSFNGPGEPIIERPEEAIAFLLNMEIDALYIEGYRVTRA